MEIVAAIGLVIVVLTMVLFGRLLWRAYRSLSWPVTQGVVTASKIRVEMPGDEEGYLPCVQFDYKIAGNHYVGTQIRALNWTRAWREQAVLIADKYPVGKSVVVHYHPKYPGNSVLEPGFNLWELAAMAILGIVATVLILVMFKRIDYGAW